MTRVKNWFHRLYKIRLDGDTFSVLGGAQPRSSGFHSPTDPHRGETEKRLAGLVYALYGAGGGYY